MKFLIFNLTLIAIALGIARQMGITIPRPHIPAPCTKEFALIIAAQAVISYFSSHISKLLTEQPKRYQGDEDGILDVKLLENKRKENQGILLLTTGFMTCIILLAHLFCQNGPWTGFPPDDEDRYLVMCMLGTMVELGFMMVSGASKSLGRDYRGKARISLDTRADHNLVFPFNLKFSSGPLIATQSCKRCSTLIIVPKPPPNYEKTTGSMSASLGLSRKSRAIMFAAGGSLKTIPNGSMSSRRTNYRLNRLFFQVELLVERR
jgi:hypothetical protein